jgi:hypothetical protein
MTCANSVLPVFMITLRDCCQSREVTHFWLSAVQIGTKQN